MKKIELTQGKFALVDDEDYEYLMQWKWYFSRKSKSKNNCYAQCYDKNTKYPITLHRILLTRYNITSKLVDHINRNSLDNRKINLRTSDYSKNAHNSETWGKFQKGVYLASKNRYRSYIQSKGKQIYLGLFKTPEEASAAYQEASKKYYGNQKSLQDLINESKENTKSS